MIMYSPDTPETNLSDVSLSISMDQRTGLKVGTPLLLFSVPCLRPHLPSAGGVELHGRQWLWVSCVVFSFFVGVC